MTGSERFALVLPRKTCFSPQGKYPVTEHSGIIMALTNYNAGRNLALSVAGSAARSLARNYGESIMAYGRRRIRGGMRNLARSLTQRRRSAGRQSLRRRNRKFVSGGSGVTSQYDRTLQYRKKSMPRYRKKRWKSFVRKIHAISEKELGSRTVLFNNQISTLNETPGNQTCLTLALYPQKGSASWLTDINQISAMENTGNSTAALGETVSNSTKYLFQSGVLDITVRNSSTIASGTETISLSGKMEIDVYEMVASRDFVDDTTNRDHISACMAVGFADTATIGGAADPANIAINKRGCTPWECPLGLGRFRIKILKKTKYFLPAGDTFTYQIRDPKRHVLIHKDMVNELGPNLPKLTRFVYIIGKLVPGLTLGTGLGQYAEKLDVGVTRKYFYKIEGMSEDRDRYVSASGSAVLPS